MNKKYSVLIGVLLLINIAYGQPSKTSVLYNLVTEKRGALKTIDSSHLFTQTAIEASARINSSLSEKSVLILDKNVSLKMYKSRSANISLAVPSVNGTTYQLELILQDISSTGDFSFGTIEGNGIAKKTGSSQGLHYRGYVNGDPSSIASFSIFSNGEVMGLFSNREGNFNIGKTGDNINEYILFNSKNMTGFPGFACGTSEVPAPTGNSSLKQTASPQTEAAPPVLCKKVRIYWEADYKLYSNNFNSNLTNTANYLTGLFNQVAIMYQNEGILIELTDVYIWTTPDPYTTTSSSNGLNTFKSRWNGLGDNFKADLAVLLDGAPTNNGGIAFLLDNDLCNRAYAYGYVDIYASYNTVPAYSWDVEGVTHEMGHMMGSHHTHWCGWKTGANGTCGAIDDCYPVEASTNCTTCAAATTTNPPPAGFTGTVMSYCYLRSGIGVNLANGFGPLPQAAMRSSINNATCPLFDNKWTGAISSAWEDPANWGCGIIPNATTDVTIPGGLSHYPVISSKAVCRKLIQTSDASVLVKTGFALTVTGTSQQ